MTAHPRWTDEELLLALEVVDKRQWRAGNKSSREFVELSRLLRAANLPGFSAMDETFRSPSSVSLKVSNLVGANPNIPGGMRDSRREIELVARFLRNREAMLAEAASVRSRIATGIAEDSEISGAWDEEELAVAIEGGATHVLALRRERSRALRRSKVRDAAMKGQPLTCEVCAFDFFDAYGQLGRDYIEVHHRTPLHVSGETATELDDLALLCANCHRMIHRRGWIPVPELIELVQVRKGLQPTLPGY